jgi:hypothetical protein
MLKLLKWVGIIVAVLALSVAIFLFGMRFHDGPIEIITGGPFKTGELAAAPDDWTSITDRREIEFQTLEPDSSRIVWLVVLDKRLYVISGYMNTDYGKIWKQWPHHLVADDRVIVRIDGALYEQRMVRMMEHPQLLELMRINYEKYAGGDGSELTAEMVAEGIAAGDFWLFEVVDRET